MSDVQPHQLPLEQIFVNLPVADLSKAKEFYTALGWTLNPTFSDDNAASFVVGDHIVVMLLKHDYFQSFHDRATYEPGNPREVLNALAAASPADVDELIRRARDAGGSITREPAGQGPMYGAAFDDLDGHGWEIMHMDSAEFE